ncbi:MAG: TIGR04255 family protein [Phycisphaerae bacterium]|nr:TIGR04255 family protein [Phycisphaerae bacterium]
MNVPPMLTIDPSEKFPHLERAPIVEAVIHWRARSEGMLEQDSLLAQLKSRLPGYPNVQTQREVQWKLELGPPGAAHTQTDQWHGLRFESIDGRNIAQFTRDGFVFSRVNPYEGWDLFAGEAKSLWRVHSELTKPTAIERLGVRFINRIVPVDLGKLDDVLRLPPRQPHSLEFLPIEDFLHRTRFSVPGYPYSVNVIQVAQPPVPPENTPGLILDIDVFTVGVVELEEQSVDDHLSKMRWLKNKAFHAMLTSRMIEHFKGPQE